MVFQKAIDDIVQADIEALVDGGVPEGQTLDYKQALPAAWADRDRADLLADLCSFANTQGGWILYGVREERDVAGRATGIPEAATGLAGLNADGERLRIDQMAAAGIEPRIPGLRIRAVDGFSDGPVLVVHIPRSWLRPHMRADRSPFYGRNSAGKYRLDVQQIRASMLGTEAVAERIRRFRQDRLGAILTGAGPGPLCAGCKLVMHVVPLASFESSPSGVSIPLEQARLLPPGGGAHDYRYNLDGRLGFEHFLDQEDQRRKVDRYVQVFRTGPIEALSCFSRENGQRVGGRSLEGEVIRALTDYLREYLRWGVPAPVFVMLSIVEAAGWGLVSELSAGRSFLFDRDLIELPEVFVEDLGADAGQLLRPAFDTLWQASGAEGSPSYDENGRRM